MYENVYEEAFARSIFDSVMTGNDTIAKLASPWTMAMSFEERIRIWGQTSDNIKLGKGVEAFLNAYANDHGYTTIATHIKNSTLQCDFYAQKDNTNIIILLEIKLKDNHDSKNKTAIASTLKEKIKILHELHPNSIIKAGLWFVDPYYSKNMNYYKKEQIPLIYGDQIDEFLELPNCYQEALNSFMNFKKTYKPNNMANNFLDYRPKEWLQFLTCNTPEIYNFFFPEGIPYKTLYDIFSKKSKSVNQQAVLQICKERM